MSDSIDGITNNHLEIFREIGNIGAGHAATALAGLLNLQIRMTVPDVQIVPFNGIVNIMNGPETLVVGILVDMKGGLNGFILMVFSIEDAKEIAMLALGEAAAVVADSPPDSFNDIEMSALQETVNILVGAYLKAISEMTGITVNQAVPQIAIDMVGAIVSVAAIEYGETGDSVLFLKTQFSDVKKDMAGHFFLIPDFSSYKILIESLDMEV